MRLGMIGLGRMGANMVRRLIKQGHNCVVFDRCQNLWTIWSRRRRQLPARSQSWWKNSQSPELSG
jgi:6-phosphogluconate dehydrogenase (decarboxylating)